MYLVISGKLLYRDVTLAEREQMKTLYIHYLRTEALRHLGVRVYARKHKIEVPLSLGMSNSQVIKELRRTLRFFAANKEQISKAINIAELDILVQAPVFIDIGLVSVDEMFSSAL